MADNVIACPHCAKPVVVPKGEELPRGLDTICQQFPALCKQVEGLRAEVRQVNDAMSRHPKPTADFITKFWKNCPDCSNDFERLLREHPELFQPKEAGSDKPFWEKDWQREDA